MEDSDRAASYEPPALEVIGSVAAMTQVEVVCTSPSCADAEGK